MYDVFISFKDSDEKGGFADRELAQKVYEFLTDKGLKVFLSFITLKELGKDHWKSEIEKAIYRSKVLVTVVSKKEYINSPWLLKERVKFLTLKESDETKALYNYITEPMSIDALPEELSYFQTFKDEDKNALESLFIFIKNHFATYHIRELPSNKEDEEFTKNVMDILKEKRLVVLFSQDFVNIAPYYQSIKQKCKDMFENSFYIVSVPSYTDDQKRYFEKIAKDCYIEKDVCELQDWKEAMVERLRASSEDLFLLINDLEDGNIEFDKQFAKTLRELTQRFSNLHVIFVGRKALASLVYGAGNLSPLNTAKTLFFPSSDEEIEEEIVASLFDRFVKNKEDICKLLEKEELGRFRVWSANKILNELFWKNILVKKEKKYAWRDNTTKEIAKEVLECEDE